MTKDSFVLWLNQERKARDWTQNELARQAGIQSSTISQVLTHLRNPGLNFCQGIARALKVPTEEVLHYAGILQPYSRDSGPTPLIEIYEIVKGLDAEDREKLLVYLQERYGK